MSRLTDSSVNSGYTGKGGVIAGWLALIWGLLGGAGGATTMQNGTAATTTGTLAVACNRFVCLCDTGAVTFIINSLSWTINAGEVFDERIYGAEFTAVTFSSTGDFRFYGRAT